MDLTFTPEEEAFRAKVRVFARPARISNEVARGKHHPSGLEEWRDLNAQGWLANHWPREHGVWRKRRGSSSSKNARSRTRRASFRSA